jgi:uncharacterized membrane protein
MSRRSGPPPAGGRRAARRRQGGSILISTAMALSLVVIVLIGTELGYLFHVKREMQKSVDLAALAATEALAPTDCATARGAALANAARNLPPGLALAAADVTCGRWDPAVNAAPLYFAAPGTGQSFNAVSISMARTPALLMPSLPGNVARTIRVAAVAARRAPRAALTIRSTLVTIDSPRAALLDAVFGGLLGGSVTLGVSGWQGLVDGKLRLLGYLDQLAIAAGVGAGQYDQVLRTPVSVGTLLQAAATALQRQGNAAQATLDALAALRVAANLPVAQPLVRLGDLLGVQGGTQAAALQLDLQVFQLAEGLVQLANGQNGLVASVPLSVPGLLNVTSQVRVIEPPQLSAVGDPALAAVDPTGPNRIAVRTAQVRALITVELPALNAFANLVNSVVNATAGLISTLISLLSLKLGDLLSCVVFCSNQLVTEVKLLPAPLRIDVSLDAGGGGSHVSAFTCPAAAKTLTTATRTAVADLRVGKIGETTAQARALAFASNVAPLVQPLPLLDISAKSCSKAVGGLITSCGASKPFYGGGLGLRALVPVGVVTRSQVFDNLPDLGGPPLYQSISSVNLVDTLGNSLKSASTLIQALPATGSANGGQASVLTGITTALSTTIGLLGAIVSNVLSPLLDTTLDVVLRQLLGIDLAKTEVAGELTCAQGAALVY